MTDTLVPDEAKINDHSMSELSKIIRANEEANRIFRELVWEASQGLLKQSVGDEVEIVKTIIEDTEVTFELTTTLNAPGPGIRFRAVSDIRIGPYWNTATYQMILTPNPGNALSSILADKRWLQALN